MYEDLIHRLRDEASKWCTNCCYRGDSFTCTSPREKYCDSCTQLQAADAIEELNKLVDAQLAIIKQYQEYLSKTKWIPVTERLPEMPKNYPHCELRQCFFLVTLESTAVVSCGYDFENKRWREFFKVTHWMPLPAPPAVDTGEQPLFTVNNRC